MMNDNTPLGPTPVIRLRIILLVAFVYFLTARLGLFLALTGTNATSVWPPTGIAMAAIMILGYRVWPGIFLGAFVFNILSLLSIHVPFPGASIASISTAFGNTLEAVIAVFLARRYCRQRNPFDGIQDTLTFMVWGALLSTVIAAAIGSASFVAVTGHASIFWKMFTVWWLGDSIGAIIVTPAILTFGEDRFAQWDRRKFIEMLCLVCTVVLFLLLIFLKDIHIEYIIILVLIWTAVRFTRFETSLVILCIAGLAITGTIHGYGPFVMESQNGSILSLQSFNGTIGLSTILLAIVIHERKRARELLEESQSMLQVILDAIPVVVHWKNLNSIYMGCNRLFAEYAGMESPAQIIGKTDFDLPWKQFAPLYQTRDAEVIRTGQPLLNYEQPGSFSDGSIFWMRQSKLPLRNSTGEIIGTLSTFEDITDSRRVEEALRESEQKYRDLVENANSIILRWNRIGTILFLNEFGQRLFGFSDEEIVGKNVIGTITPRTESSGRDLHQLMEDIERDPIAFERNANENIRRDGSRVSIAWTNRAVFDDQGQLSEIFSVGTDITEQNRAREALHQSEERYRTLFESATEGIFLMQGDRFIDCNPATLLLFACTREEIVGQTPHRFSPPLQPDGSDSAWAAMEKIRAAAAGVSQHFEWRHSRYDGTPFDAEVTLNRIVVNQQSLLLAFVRDITERKKADNKIRQLLEEVQRHTIELEKRVAERTADLALAKERAESADRLKSAFLATMSHELRTPLNSIIGFTGILRQGLAGPLNKEQHKQMGMVQTSAHHLLELINDVLDISKIEADQLEVALMPFHFSQSVDKVVAVVRPLAEQKGLQLRVNNSLDDNDRINSDARRIEQILFNLVNNAIKFTESGSVTIECERVANVIRIRVIDTGIGIRAEDMEKLFKPFSQIDTGTTRSHEGTGLGLSICRKLSEKLGGTMAVESVFGSGSVFTFQVPVTEERANELYNSYH